MRIDKQAPASHVEADPRQTRRDKHERHLSERSLWILRWIASMYAIRYDQLRELLSRMSGQRNHKAPGAASLTTSAVNQVIANWQEAPSLVFYDRMHVPGWIWLTPFCERMLELPYSEHHMRPGPLASRYYANLVRLDFELRHPEAKWVSERDLRARLPQRKKGEKVGAIPDGQIWLPTGRRPIAVEIELSPKRDKEINEHLQTLLAGPDAVYRKVLYFVTDKDPIAEQAWRVVTAARDRLAAHLQARVDIIPLEKVGTPNGSDPAVPTKEDQNEPGKNV